MRTLKEFRSLNKNELIRSKGFKRNSEIRNAFSNQTGTAYAILPMYGLLDGEPLNYDGETDIMADTTTSYERGVVVVGRAKAWVESDFAEDITAGGGFYGLSSTAGFLNTLTMWTRTHCLLF